MYFLKAYCRFQLLLDMKQEIKPFPKIAIISQKYVVSQIKFVSGQNLTGESERYCYVFFTPWSKNYVGEFWLLVWFVFNMLLNLKFL